MAIINHLPLKFLFGKRIVFPFYHLVSDDDCPHIKHLYPVKRLNQFEKELDFFQKNFAPISLEELINHIKNNTKPEKPSFFLSFDDGLRECNTLIMPVLKNRNLKAAFFLNTDFTDNKALFFRYKISLIIDHIAKENLKTDYTKKDLLALNYSDTKKIDQIAKNLNLDFNQFLENERPYMNWSEVQELKEEGFYIGGHSADHPLYSEIELKDQFNQTIKSMEEIERRVGPKHKIFSFPFTDDGVSSEFFEKIYKENRVELTFGTAGIKDDDFRRNLQRLPMDKCTDNVRTFVMNNFLAYKLKKLTGKEKVNHN